MISLTKIPALIGKENLYVTPHGIRIGALWRVMTTVKFEEEGLSLDVHPKKKAITDYIPYDEIENVIAEKYMYKFRLIYAILFVLLAIPTYGATLILALLYLWIGRGGRVVIKRRTPGSPDVIIYMRSFNQAEEFAEYFKEDAIN